ncbi:unnamed protein product, partial [Ectocarpus sp. 8 AP-2014]
SAAHRTTSRHHQSRSKQLLGGTFYFFGQAPEPCSAPERAADGVYPVAVNNLGLPSNVGAHLWFILCWGYFDNDGVRRTDDDVDAHGKQESQLCDGG